MQTRIKIRIMVILIAMLVALAAIFWFYEPRVDEQQFSGLFVRESSWTFILSL